MKEALIIFAKNRIKGKTKTRLAKTLGNEQALQIYDFLQKNCLKATKALPMQKFVFYSEFIAENDIWNNKIFTKKLQKGNDIGEKMHNAIQETSQSGFSKIVLIGTDIPDLSTEIIIQAFSQLEQNDVVIGPAKDGGYYLIGMKKTHSAIFLDTKWSHEQVFRDTIRKIEQLSLSYSILPELQDIDYESDWLEWQNSRDKFV